MKKLLPLCLLLPLLGLPVVARPPAAQPGVSSRLFNYDFVEADLVAVVKQLAHDMGLNCYIGPGVEGKVTIHLRGVTPLAALQQILRQSAPRVAYKTPGGALLVGLPENLEEIQRSILGKAVAPRTKQHLAGMPCCPPPPPPPPGFNTESYAAISENGYFDPRQQPLSTFSIDVDTASYANVRRFLEQGQMPPSGAVRLEELINYFTYDYPDPGDGHPFSLQSELSQCPWDAHHQLLSIALQGRHVEAAQVPPCNLVFLLDVSGSMGSPQKLPLLKQSLKMLVDRLRPQDSVAIAVYAGSSGTVLEPTSGQDKTRILGVLDQLEAGGSTNGAAGIQLAYDLARKNFHREGVNRVVLCTDGDFNVGVTNHSDLLCLIEKQRQSGVFLSVLGFGMGNLKDDTMELLADKGNGNYAYIDSLFEARKVLVEQAGGTLVPIAKDVKIQVEFNPSRVAAYRLLGYENRQLQAHQFNDDKVDAGEMGAGQCVTALYEVVPAGEPVPQAEVDPLKYQKVEDGPPSDELATLKVRYKQPAQDQSQLLSVAVNSQALAWEEASPNLRLAATVAAFAAKLRQSNEGPPLEYSTLLQWARSCQGADREGYRADLIRLVEKAAQLKALDGERARKGTPASFTNVTAPSRRKPALLTSRL